MPEAIKRLVLAAFLCAFFYAICFYAFSVCSCSKLDTVVEVEAFSVSITLNAARVVMFLLFSIFKGYVTLLFYFCEFINDLKFFPFIYAVCLSQVPLYYL